MSIEELTAQAIKHAKSLKADEPQESPKPEFAPKEPTILSNEDHPEKYSKSEQESAKKEDDLKSEPI